MKKEFTVVIVSFEDKGTGVSLENDRAVLSCGISECLDLESAQKKFSFGKIAAGESSSFVCGEGLLYMDKRRNPDIIKSVRLALTFGADGVVIPFGNNKNRPYVKDGSSYTAAEMISAVCEIKRLSPLFGRIFVDGTSR